MMVDDKSCSSLCRLMKRFHLSTLWIMKVFTYLRRKVLKLRRRSQRWLVKLKSYKRKIKLWPTTITVNEYCVRNTTTWWKIWKEKFGFTVVQDRLVVLNLKGWETIPYHIRPYQTRPYHTTPHHTIPHHTTPHHTIPYHTIPHHTIPYHTTPYHTTPHHTIPHHTIPHHTTPYQTTPHHTIPYHTTPHHTTPHHTIPYHTIPHHTTPYHTTPYHTTPYHTIPYHTIPHHTTPHHTIPHHITPHHTTPHHTIPHHTTPYLPLKPSSNIFLRTIILSSNHQTSTVYLWKQAEVQRNFSLIKYLQKKAHKKKSLKTLT